MSCHIATNRNIGHTLSHALSRPPKGTYIYLTGKQGYGHQNKQYSFKRNFNLPDKPKVKRSMPTFPKLSDRLVIGHAPNLVLRR
jgi:hypothetical protein